MIRKQTRNGVTVQGTAGHYTTLDGRYEVARDDEYITYCDNPHPLSTGGHCEGMAEHFYSRWHIWDQEVGDYAFGDSPGEYETFSEAMESLARNLQSDN